MLDDEELSIEVELEDGHGTSLGLLDEMGDMQEYDERMPPLADGSSMPTKKRRKAE